MNEKNIHEVNFTSETSELVAAVEKMKRGLEPFVEFCEIVAKQRKAAYDAYMKEGFSADQALELCKSLY